MKLQKILFSGMVFRQKQLFGSMTAECLCCQSAEISKQFKINKIHIPLFVSGHLTGQGVQREQSAFGCESQNNGS